MDSFSTPALSSKKPLQPPPWQIFVVWKSPNTELLASFLPKKKHAINYFDTTPPSPLALSQQEATIIPSIKQNTGHQLNCKNPHRNEVVGATGGERVGCGCGFYTGVSPSRLPASRGQHRRQRTRIHTRIRTRTRQQAATDRGTYVASMGNLLFSYTIDTFNCMHS